MNPFSPSNLNSPFLPNTADLSPEDRDIALKRAADTLGAIDKMRRGLEMPIEQMPLVIDAYNAHAAALLAEKERKAFAEHTTRVPLVVRSENNDRSPQVLLPSQVTTVTVRPQGVFRPEDISIHGDPARWNVHELKIGNRTQVLGNSHLPIPGKEFGPNGVCAKLKLETCQTAMDLVIVVEYIGPVPEGEVFEATVVGTSIRY